MGSVEAAAWCCCLTSTAVHCSCFGLFVVSHLVVAEHRQTSHCVFALYEVASIAGVKRGHTVLPSLCRQWQDSGLKSAIQYICNNICRPLTSLQHVVTPAHDPNRPCCFRPAGTLTAMGSYQHAEALKPTIYTITLLPPCRPCRELFSFLPVT